MAAGVVLQLQQDGASLAMDDSLIQVFGRPLAATGDEDADVTFCDAQRHRALAARPNNFVIAQFASVFVDGIKRH